MTGPIDPSTPSPPPPRNRLRTLLKAWMPSRPSEASALPAPVNDPAGVQAPATPDDPPSRGPVALPRATTTAPSLVRRLVPGLAAVGAALAFRAFYAGPMLPRPAFGVGALVFLLAAAVLALRRRGWGGKQSLPNGPTLGEVLFTIGILWGTLWLL